MTGLREQRTSFRINLPAPRAVVVVALVPIPQDVAFHHEQFTQKPAIHGVLGQANRYIVSVLLDHPKMFSGFFGTRIHRVAVLRIQRHRLLHQRVVARAQRLHAHRTMHRVWCHHGNHVKSTGGEHGLVIVKPLQVRILVELVFQRLRIRVADGNEIGSLIRVKHRDVAFADAPTAYDGKLNVFLIHLNKDKAERNVGCGVERFFSANGCWQLNGMIRYLYETMKRAFIIDYGVGNIGSLQNMYRRVSGVMPILTSDLTEIESGDKVLLPGVGNFGYAMQRLEKLGLSEQLKGVVANPEVGVLGICLGAQLLLDGSEEAPDVRGLGLISGECVKFNKAELSSDLRIPHMGWAEVESNKHPLSASFAEDVRFYFVHSYRMVPKEEQNALYHASHGNRFCAGIIKDNVVGVQFHPEKSHRFGMGFLESFSNWEPK